MEGSGHECALPCALDSSNREEQRKTPTNDLGNKVLSKQPISNAIANFQRSRRMIVRRTPSPPLAFEIAYKFSEKRRCYHKRSPLKAGAPVWKVGPKMGPGIWIGQEGGSSLTETHSAELAALATGPFYLFKDWPVAEVPRVGSAVYTIWDVDGPLVYVGMSGRSAKATGNGPWGRLNSHASGRSSGDQFCIYVCDRLILGGLHNRLHDVAAAALSLIRPRANT